MKLRTVYTTQLKAALGLGSEEIEVETPCTLAQLIQSLAERHGETFRDLVMDSEGRLLPSILLCVGDEQASGEGTTHLKDGDEVTILSAISGG